MRILLLLVVTATLSLAKGGGGHSSVHISTSHPRHNWTKPPKHPKAYTLPKAKPVKKVIITIYH